MGRSNIMCTNLRMGLSRNKVFYETCFKIFYSREVIKSDEVQSCFQFAIDVVLEKAIISSFSVAPSAS